MAVVLALGAAMVYGSADFLGGLASRRHAAMAVAFAAQAAGLAALVAVLPLLGPATVTPRDLVLGGVGGLFGGVGLVLLYRCLAVGPMSVVAPVTALAASVVPVVAGVALGERPDALAVVGIGVALVAVALITRETGVERVDGGGPSRTDRLRGAGWALVAGASFGMFFVALHGTGDDAGLYPLLGARLVSVPVLALITLRSGQALTGALRGRGAASVVACGVLDTAANALYLVALRHGMLSMVSVVVGLYPAATVLLAQGLLAERIGRVQVGGLAVAAAAATLIAV